jgi:Ca-activated chloride channel family protein
MFEITSTRDEMGVGGNRPPIDLCIVLDESGSMSGSKIEHSKQAIIQIIQNLRPTDRVTLLAYASNARVIFHNRAPNDSARNELIGLVSKLSANGGTALYDGLNLAYQTMRTQSSPPGSVRRVFLFSDGEANIGISDNLSIFALATQMQGSGLTVSAFGIGEGFNEKLMTGIAEHGAGDYLFIDGASAIQRLVNIAFNALGGVVATNARLYLKPAPGVSVTKVFGWSETDGLLLGDMRAGDTRRMLVELKSDLSSLATADGSMTTLLEYHIQSQPTHDALSIVNGVLQLKLTSDAPSVESSKSGDVKNYLAVKTADELDQRVLKHLENGDLQASMAEKQAVVDQLENVVLTGSDFDAVVETARKRAKRSLATMYHPDKSMNEKVKTQSLHNNQGRYGSTWYDEL